MGVFDGTEYVGKETADLAAGHSDPTAAPGGTWVRWGKAIKSAAGSSILDAGQALITGMRLTTGWNDPERGDPFGRSTARFISAGETLDSAYPGEDWQGAGAQAYATANRSHAGRTESMATLDRGVQTVIAREAYQVAHRRDNLDDQSNYLGDLSYLTWPLGLAPGAGKAMKVAVELSAVSAALTICSAELLMLSRETDENAAELRELAGEYSALTRKEAPPDLGDVPPQPPSDEQPAAEPRADESMDRPGPAQPAPEVVPTSLSTTTPFRARPPGAVPVAPANPVVGAAVPTGEAATAPAFPIEMVSGMASAFGAVGGMIGSMTAPLAAALTGAAGAAAQSLSTLTSPDGPDAVDEMDEPPIGEDPPDTDSDGDRDLPDGTASAGEGSGAAPPEAVVESEESRREPPNTLESVRPSVPPAATRPPQ
ncbi:hypothetical protein NGTWS0302_09740 [Mycolicibacterium cyprinidarum]|uniref:ESX-1 secretion-associated protein EspA/EspE-like domain-containing protein n=1 Tax=Mycolicibacterium cyprinidarum TaxID=2860311 RepID=A0ABQ4VC19_9MYCO|nr:hypothetical protein NGTWS1702_14520 [Mycolicibacterium sp. NGTWSNA01]GJF15657.1 hypothetical protein NGTWS0302_09740 [Mycolicibacterium sp. NGTWS0302]